MTTSKLKRLIQILILFTLSQIISFQIAYSSQDTSGEIAELWKQADDLKQKGYYAKAIPFINKVLDFRRGGATLIKLKWPDALNHWGSFRIWRGDMKRPNPS